VKRTFSEFSRFPTGLPGLQTHEADGQDLGDFAQPLGGLMWLIMGHSAEWSVKPFECQSNVRALETGRARS
jgi:hypothetical protein